MLFNSIDFAIFLPIVFLLYWFVTKNNLRAQNLLILVASYIFYGWWDWRFLGLIFLSTIVDYSIGLLLHKTADLRMRKVFLWASILINLGILGFFKYYNFFIENLVDVFRFFGQPIGMSSLNIILPVGISFYTFQTMSYTIDIYRKKLEPTKDFIGFAAFVSFFPQLVAGPIERASHLLPQLLNRRKFEYYHAVDGLRQILWGLFKKIVIADNCAEIANEIFNNSGEMNGSALWLGVVFFTIQIYGDFSGYSDIAIGTAKLFGIRLMQNFAFPFFSRDIAEFWRRWHISLMTWFRDYVFIPLGGSRSGKLTTMRNVMIVFVVSGLWHGDNWTYISFGFLHGVYMLALLVLGKTRKDFATVAQNRLLPNAREVMQMSITFLLVVLSFVLFRAENMLHAAQYFDGMVSWSALHRPSISSVKDVILVSLFVVVLFFVEWYGRETEHGLEKIGQNWAKPMRYALYYAIIASIIWFGGKEQEFIYFQF
ncbi:MAG: MBOAT family protein [Weeksellaceae bacterium]|nr:MBOAT family protein [Weeksellaceae bacterium]